MKRVSLLAMLLPLTLAGCVFGGHGHPSGSAPAFNAPSRQETRACYADLSRLGVRFNPLPDRDHGGGCRLVGTVQLIDIGLPVTNLTAMRCGLARGFVGWTRGDVAPAARAMLGSELVRIESFGSYACRNTIGTEHARLSGHAIANAVDIGGFVLADGRRITVADGWRSSDPGVQAFLRAIRLSACRRFGTVLGPDYNAVHANHFHLEDDHANFCR